MRRALFPLVTAAGGWIAATLPALAQCPMCRTAVGAQGPEAARTVNLAIIVMFVPALALFSSVFVLSFRYRNSPRPDEGDDQRSPRNEDDGNDIP